MNRKPLQWMSRTLIATGAVIALTVGVGVNQAQATAPVCTEGEVVYNVPGAYSTVLEEGKTVTIDTGLVVPVGKNAYLTSYFSWGGYLDSFLSLNGPAQTWRVVLGGGATGYTADPADGADNFLAKGNFNATLAGTGGTLVIQHSSVQSPTGVSGANAIYPTGFCFTLMDTPTTTTTTTSTTTTSTTTTSSTTTTVAPTTTTLPPTTVAPTTTVLAPPPLIVPPASTVPVSTIASTTTTAPALAPTVAPTTTTPSVTVAGVTVVQTTIAAAPAAQVSAGDLAYTGSPSTVLMVFALILIGLGSSLLVMQRRLD